jgi:hypothetical protein
MYKKSEKKSKPDMQITVEPGVLNTITSTYDSIQTSAAGLTAALAASLPLSQYLSKIEESSGTWRNYTAQLKEFEKLYSTIPNSAQLAAGVLGLYRGANNAEEMINELIPQIQTGIPVALPQQEKNKIIDDAEEMKKEISFLRAELKKLKLEKESYIKGVTAKKVTKRGPQRYSDQQELNALKKWAELDKSIHPIYLKDFLRQEFGQNADGSPVVAESTFHGWRQRLKGKSLYKDS